MTHSANARYVQIPWDRIHPRIGLQTLSTDPTQDPIRPDTTFAAEKYGAILHHKRDATAWLDVQITIEGGKPFLSNAQHLQQTLLEHQAQNTNLALRVLEDKWRQDNAFRVGSATRGDKLKVSFSVDTNHEKFVAYAQEMLVNQSEGVSFDLTVTFFHVERGREDLDQLILRLVFKPCTPVGPDDWVIAFDVGNTNSTVALMNPINQKTHDLQMLSTRIVDSSRGLAIGYLIPETKAVPSDVRLDRVRTWLANGSSRPLTRRVPDYDSHPDDDKLNAIEWRIGQTARAGSARGLLLGAKRMAADRQVGTISATASHRIIPDNPAQRADDQENFAFEMDTRFPLELLACRMLHHCREARQRWPYKIALTYPTTYSRAELIALQRAVLAGWLRMQGRRQRSEHDHPSQQQPYVDQISRTLQGILRGPIDLSTQSLDPIIRLRIDEASAAAFFYLYRKIFEEIQGGLTAFRYLYPDGLTMLLYDCGGGTTDIALVRATVGRDGTILHIQVRGRSGVRDFGGDDITRQVARLLKAKIQSVLATARGQRSATPMPMLPTRTPVKPDEWNKFAAELEQFIKASGASDPGDELVPTKDLPNLLPQEPRRAAALALWQLAEELKIQLATPTAGPAATGGPAVVPEVRLTKDQLTRERNELTRAILPIEPQKEAELKRKLEGITISRTEIDALIYKPVMRSIRNCNNLIQKVFNWDESEGTQADEIHWVVASGNAVQYPLLQQMLRKHVAAAFLDGPDNRFLFDALNAKDATAKGAALALALIESPGQQFAIKFESDLSERLPFDVAVPNLRVGQNNRVLYQEHTHYRELATMDAIEVPIARGNEAAGPGNQFVLRRRFPGDDQFSDYLVFQFEGDIQGKNFLVRYDETSPFEFVVTDSEGNPGRPKDLTAGQVYRAVCQRGDI